jgi:ABC-type molybdate transport system permease subunit
MKKLGWKAIGYALWIFGMMQLITVPLGMMSAANLVEFNLGVILLLLILGPIIYGFVMLGMIGREYITYLENKEQK